MLSLERRRMQVKHQETNKIPMLTLFLWLAPEQLEEQHDAASAGTVTCGMFMERFHWGP